MNSYIFVYKNIQMYCSNSQSILSKCNECTPIPFLAPRLSDGKKIGNICKNCETGKCKYCVYCEKTNIDVLSKLKNNDCAECFIINFLASKRDNGLTVGNICIPCEKGNCIKCCIKEHSIKQ